MASLWNGDTCQCCLATVLNQTKPQTLINAIIQSLSAQELVPLILDVLCMHNSFAGFCG